MLRVFFPFSHLVKNLAEERKLGEFISLFAEKRNE